MAQRGTTGARPSTQTTRWLTAILLTLAALGVVGPTSPAGAAPGDTGVEGPAYVEAKTAPTVSANESKLWYHDGSWFAVMLKTGDPSSGGGDDADVAVFKRVGGTWVATDTTIDSRSTTKQDVVANGDDLYVMSHKKKDGDNSVEEINTSNYTRLYKLTYDEGSGTYGNERDFTIVNHFQAESATLDVDSAGVLWATWTQTGKVNWQRSTDDGVTWSAPTALTVDHAAPTEDDISSIVAYGDRVGIMWSAQTGADDGFWFTSTAAGTATPAWSATETVRSGPGAGDDHISLKNIGGEVVAAVKSSTDTGTSPLVLLERRNANGTWTGTTAWTGSTNVSRPVLAIDATNRQVHLFAADEVGSDTGNPLPTAVYTKTTSLDAPAFDAAEVGTPVMARDSGHIAEATTTKQTVTADSGLVVLASDPVTMQYWTHSEAITPPVVDTPPTAPGSVTARAGVKEVTLTWSAATAGSDPITAYRITATPPLPAAVPDQPTTATGSPITVAAPNDVARTFQVKAVAGSTTGPATSSASVTPSNHVPFASTDAFAERQAQDFFGRPATAAEKSRVRALLDTDDQPGSAAVLSTSFFASEAVAGAELKGQQAQIARLYVAYYLRQPDLDGFNYWIERIQNGYPLESISQFFAGAPEFRNRYGSVDDSQFVDLVYDNLFSRTPDADGRAYWLDRLDKGLSRGRMMTLFSEIGENVTKTTRTASVSVLFRSMLERMPTDAELDLAASAPDLAAIVDALLVSDEYRARVAA